MATAPEPEKTPKPLSYGLLLFPGFEVLDAAGPIDALNVSSAFGIVENMKLSVIAETMGIVTPASDLQAKTARPFLGQQHYKPTHTFEDAPPLDVLIVPGGRGTRRSNKELQPTLEFIQKTYRGYDGHPPLKYLFSICTGSMLFAQAGLLDGHRATSNKKAWATVTPHAPKAHWIAKARWVESGNIWTTSGVTAGLDGMIALIAKVYGDQAADQVCDIIEHERQRDAGNDPFAEKNGCEDVLPTE